MKTVRVIATIMGAAALLGSCRPMVQSKTRLQLDPLPEGSRIEVLYLLEKELPEGLILVGRFSIGEKGFANNCNYDYVMIHAAEEARISGADFIHITEHKKPDDWSTCHRISGMMYRKPPPVSEEDGYWIQNETGKSDENKSKGHDNQPTESIDGTEDNSEYDPYAVEYSRTKPTEVQQITPVSGPYVQYLYPSAKAEKKPKDGAASRMAVSAGFSRRISPVSNDVPSEFVDHINGLRNGYYLGGEMGFKIANWLYLGPRFDRFRSSNSMMLIVNNGVNNTLQGELKETITISYYALQATQMVTVGGGNSSVFIAYSLGYMQYTNIGNGPLELSPNSYTFAPFSYKGGNLGFRLSGGFDLGLSKSTKLSLGLALASASIRKLQADIGGRKSSIELGPENSEGLLRLDLGAGITWLF